MKEESKSNQNSASSTTNGIEDKRKTIESTTTDLIDGHDHDPVETHSDNAGVSEQNSFLKTFFSQTLWRCKDQNDANLESVGVYRGFEGTEHDLDALGLSD